MKRRDRSAGLVPLQELKSRPAGRFRYSLCDDLTNPPVWVSDQIQSPLLRFQKNRTYFGGFDSIDFVSMRSFGMPGAGLTVEVGEEM